MQAIAWKREHARGTSGWRRQEQRWCWCRLETNGGQASTRCVFMAGRRRFWSSSSSSSCIVLYCIVLYCIVGHDSVYFSCEYKLGLRSWKSELMPYVVPISTESVPFRVLCVMSSCFRSPTDVPSSYFIYFCFRVRQTMAVVFRPLR